MPEYEPSDEEGLFPKRHPGSFPVQDHSSSPPQGPLDQDVSGRSEVVGFDPLRDGPLRYCGYANEVGEAFAAWLPPFGVPLSYAVAVAYVLVDTVDKAQRGFHDSAAKLPDADERSSWSRTRLLRLVTIERAMDTLLWQLLASVAIPGFTIHQIVFLSHLMVVAGLHLQAPADMPPQALAALSAVATGAHISLLEVQPVTPPSHARA
jgi:Mitochondrial 18 KDa protein (MTP18)